MANQSISLSQLVDFVNGTFTVPESSVLVHSNALANVMLQGYEPNESIIINAGEGLSGGGNIAASRTISLNVNSLTADATPDGASDFVVTFDASSGSHKKVLLNNLPTQSSGSLSFHNLTATTITSTTSATYIVLNGMSFTPTSGTWLVTFSASGSTTAAKAEAQYCVHVGGSPDVSSERDFNWGGGGQTGLFRCALHTQAVVTVNGNQSIEVMYRCANGGFEIYERSMILIKLL
jgi:hypothetical protein